MGKGDKIKESKPVFLLFSQVLSYTNTCHAPNPKGSTA